MQRQTFIDNMKTRGYDVIRTSNGNEKATKGYITVRLVPLASYGVYITTPTVTAITTKDATDTETLRIIDCLTVQP
jgi:hypothetical protein